MVWGYISKEKVQEGKLGAHSYHGPVRTPALGDSLAENHPLGVPIGDACPGIPVSQDTGHPPFQHLEDYLSYQNALIKSQNQ